MLSRKVLIHMTLISLKATQAGVCGRTLRPASSDCGKTWSGGSARLTWATHHQSPIIWILSRLVTLSLLFRENWDFFVPFWQSSRPFHWFSLFPIAVESKKDSVCHLSFWGIRRSGTMVLLYCRGCKPVVQFWPEAENWFKTAAARNAEKPVEPTWLIDWTCLETNHPTNNDVRLDIQWAGCVYFPHDWFVCFVTLCPIRGRFWRRRPQGRNDIETWNFPCCKISTASVF